MLNRAFELFMHFVHTIFMVCKLPYRPLPHVRYRPNWKPPGRPVYARDLLLFPVEQDSCQLGMPVCVSCQRGRLLAWYASMCVYWQIGQMSARYASMRVYWCQLGMPVCVVAVKQNSCQLGMPVCMFAVKQDSCQLGMPVCVFAVEQDSCQLGIPVCVCFLSHRTAVS